MTEQKAISRFMFDGAYIGKLYGTVRALRRKVEAERIKTVEWSNGGITWRFKATAMSVPFIPVRAIRWDLLPEPHRGDAAKPGLPSSAPAASQR